MDLKGADALFISCTALPALSIIDKLEKKIQKPVLSSNQALIWDTLEKIGKNTSISVTGRHDPCVGIRAVPVGEAMLSCVY